MGIQSVNIVATGTAMYRESLTWLAYGSLRQSLVESVEDLCTSPVSD
jgi:hypothetical protein